MRQGRSDGLFLFTSCLLELWHARICNEIRGYCGGGGVKFCVCVCVCVSLVLTVNRRRSLLLIQSTWVICLDGTGLKKVTGRIGFGKLSSFII